MPRSRPALATAIHPLAIGLIALAFAACGASPGEQGTNRAPRPRVVAASPSRPPATGAAAPSLPTDLSILAVVTRGHGLPAAYAPADLIPISAEYSSSAEIQRLRRPAAEALTQMLGDARRDGLTIKLNSGFRSYDYQAAVLRSEIGQFGCAQALRQVAAPGHSEHQLGLAADLTSADVGWDLQDSFGATPEGHWLLSHAAAYGFVLSYPQDKETTTGYAYEPWHFRFVTIPVAQAILASGKTPTEYLPTLGLPAGTTTASTADTPAPCH